ARSRRASRIAAERKDSLAGLSVDRYPIRGTFFGCCASTIGAVDSRAAVTRQTIIFVFIVATSPYRITLSALAKTLGGIVKPICFAAFKLITNSNFIGCSTGISVGFVPFRILSTMAAIRLYGSVWSGPYDIKPPLAVKSPRG